MGPLQQYSNGLQFKWAPNNNIDPGRLDTQFDVGQPIKTYNPSKIKSFYPKTC